MYVFLSNLIPLKKSVKKWDSAGLFQNTISVWGLKGVLRKWFSLNHNQFKAFQDQSYVLEYRSWINESIPTIGIKIQIFTVWKTVFLINFTGVHHTFSFDGCVTPTLGQNYLKFSTWRKTSKQYILKVWKFLP